MRLSTPETLAGQSSSRQPLPNAFGPHGTLRRHSQLICTSSLALALVGYLIYQANGLYNMVPSSAMGVTGSENADFNEEVRRLWERPSTDSFLESKLTYDPRGGLYDCDVPRGDTLGSDWFFVNLRAFTNMSFSNARLLDMAWDVGVGQIGRVIHGWILWAIILPDSMTRILEISGLPYSILIDLTFSMESLFTIFAILKATFPVRPPCCALFILSHSAF